MTSDPPVLQTYDSSPSSQNSALGPTASYLTIRSTELVSFQIRTNVNSVLTLSTSENMRRLNSLIVFVTSNEVLWGHAGV
jgi:hypothetical protein